LSAAQPRVVEISKLPSFGRIDRVIW